VKNTVGGPQAGSGRDSSTVEEGVKLSNLGPLMGGAPVKSKKKGKRWGAVLLGRLKRKLTPSSPECASKMKGG